MVASTLMPVSAAEGSVADKVVELVRAHFRHIKGEARPVSPLVLRRACVELVRVQNDGFTVLSDCAALVLNEEAGLSSKRLTALAQRALREGPAGTAAFSEALQSRLDSLTGKNGVFTRFLRPLTPLAAVAHELVLSAYRKALLRFGDDGASGFALRLSLLITKLFSAALGGDTTSEEAFTGLCEALAPTETLAREFSTSLRTAASNVFSGVSVTSTEDLEALASRISYAYEVAEKTLPTGLAASTSADIQAIVLSAIEPTLKTLLIDTLKNHESSSLTHFATLFAHGSVDGLLTSALHAVATALPSNDVSAVLESRATLRGALSTLGASGLNSVLDDKLGEVLGKPQFALVLAAYIVDLIATAKLTKDETKETVNLCFSLFSRKTAFKETIIGALLYLIAHHLLRRSPCVFLATVISCIRNELGEGVASIFEALQKDAEEALRFSSQFEVSTVSTRICARHVWPSAEVLTAPLDVALAERLSRSVCCLDSKTVLVTPKLPEAIKRERETIVEVYTADKPRCVVQFDDRLSVVELGVGDVTVTCDGLQAAVLLAFTSPAMPVAEISQTCGFDAAPVLRSMGVLVSVSNDIASLSIPTADVDLRAALESSTGVETVSAVEEEVVEKPFSTFTCDAVVASTMKISRQMPFNELIDVVCKRMEEHNFAVDRDGVEKRVDTLVDRMVIDRLDDGQIEYVEL